MRENDEPVLQGPGKLFVDRMVASDQDIRLAGGPVVGGRPGIRPSSLQRTPERKVNN